MRHPILIDQHGLLLDGRNRLAACEQMGIEPRFEVVVTDNPEDEINAANVETKPLSSGQRAMARALALFAQERRKDGRWEYGTRGGSSTSEVKALTQCGYVIDHNPTLADEILAGTVPLSTAYEAERDEQRKAAIRVERLEVLAAEASDLHRLV